MKILVISHSALLQSYQRKFEILANKLGWEVFLVTPKSWMEAGNRRIEGKSRQRGKLQVKAITCFLKNRLRSHFYPLLFFYIIFKKPDIVYVEEEPQSLVARQAAFASNFIKAKLIFFTWENIFQKYRGFKRSTEKFLYKKSDGAIAGNLEGKKILQKKGFKKPIEIIPQYGVDPKFFKPMVIDNLRDRLRIRKDEFVIGFIGRLLPEKNISSIFQAILNIEKSPKILIIGNGPSKESLEEKAVELGLTDRVIFIKGVSYDLMPKYMNLLNVLVLPSITTKFWKEQFGRVLIEAMACGVSVVGSNSGEIPNVIKDAGVVFPEGNVSELESAIRKLMSDKSFRKNIGDRGIVRVKENFTNEAIALRLHRFINLRIFSGFEAIR
ncbi:MAG: Glycosyl transferase, group 1 [uncultured bacterium]|nr:MAG: Glycosyl transferase, group 1 [uncultured bacterium]